MKFFAISLEIVGMTSFKNETVEMDAIQAQTALEAIDKAKKLYKGQEVELANGEEAFINAYNAKAL